MAAASQHHEEALRRQLCHATAVIAKDSTGAIAEIIKAMPLLEREIQNQIQALGKNKDKLSQTKVQQLTFVTQELKKAAAEGIQSWAEEDPTRLPNNPEEVRKQKVAGVCERVIAVLEKYEKCDEICQQRNGIRATLKQVACYIASIFNKLYPDSFAQKIRDGKEKKTATRCMLEQQRARLFAMKQANQPEVAPTAVAPGNPDAAFTKARTASA